VKSYEEKRRYERYEYSSPMLLYRMDFQDQYYYAEMKDYSKGGLSLLSNEKLVVDQLVYLEMKNYDEYATGPENLKTQRLGLLSNPASVDGQFNHASKLIHKNFPGQLKALFSPQHGFYAEKQDNMIESNHIMEPELNIPIYSLYSNTRIPTKKMFDKIDVLIIDLQDVGTRVYTFIYTVSYCYFNCS